MGRYVAGGSFQDKKLLRYRSAQKTKITKNTYCENDVGGIELLQIWTGIALSGDPFSRSGKFIPDKSRYGSYDFKEKVLQKSILRR